MRHGVGQDLIVILDRRHELLHGLGIRIGDEVLDHAADRRPVGLGEYHVEGDHGGALLGELVDQARDDRAWPGPLTELGQGGLVDVDDADRRGGMIGPRLDALEAVEGDVAQAAQFGGIQGAQQQRVQQYEQGDNPRRTHIVAAEQPTHAHSTFAPPANITLRKDIG